MSAAGDSACARRANGELPSLFAKGYVDNILFDETAVAEAVAYVKDNPRRLWEKRAHPELFRVLGDVKAAGGRFAAIGNKALLKAPHIFQVRVSRSYFAYSRDARGQLLKDEPPAVATREFEEKRDGFLEAAEHGAVLLSPCISEGERHIARLAFERGLRVITLSNKGFSPLYKPGGKLFDQTAKGNLLMLAPINWPYIPGEKKNDAHRRLHTEPHRTMARGRGCRRDKIPRSRTRPYRPSRRRRHRKKGGA